MPEVGKPRPCSVVDVRLAADDLGDHREPADRRGHHVGSPYGHEVAVKGCLPLPGVDHVDRLGAEDRLEVAHESEHDEPFQRCPQASRVGEG